jgi:drug/metabolite transporter (DMT)-like permease
LFLDYADLVSRKALLLFLSVGTIWGTPYFFIAIAIEDFQTPSIVFLRVLLGALILMPIAIGRGMIRATLKAWPAVLAFAVLEMVGPWFLITEAERTISSSLAGFGGTFGGQIRMAPADNIGSCSGVCRSFVSGGH